MPLYVQARLPDLFPEPELFKPERWQRDTHTSSHTFASLPFGFGTRMCVGEYVAMAEMSSVASYIIQCTHLKLSLNERTSTMF